MHNNDIPSAIQLLKNIKTPPANDNAAATMSTYLTDMVRDIFRNLDEKNPDAYAFVEHLFEYLSKLDYFMEKTAVDEMQAFFDKLVSTSAAARTNALNYGTTTVHSR